jgi:flavin-dependent dehydrogenase
VTGFDADLLVVGGGPAGLATALHARRAGMSVLVAEARAAPIDKACGEGLMPGGLAALRALGVDPPGMLLRGIRYLDAAGRRQADAPFRAGPGRGVRRLALHQAMQAAAADAGVAFTPTKINTFEQDSHGVRAGGIHARWLAGADGLHSGIRRQLGPPPVAGRPRRYGLRRHWRLAPWSDLVEVSWSDRAEAYVTPVGPDTVGVALLYRRRTGHAYDYPDLLSDFPALARRLAGAQPAGELRGAGPLRQAVRIRAAGRVLLVGDAAGYEDALTGEGISLALRQAAAAVDALVAGEPARYAAAWPGLTRRYRLLTRGLVLATTSRPVRRALVPACVLAPAVFTRVVHALAR